MVLLIKRDLASAVRGVHRVRHAGAGPAAQVCDAGGGREQDLPSPAAQRRAEIDVLGVEKEPLVQEAGGICVTAMDEQRGAAHPVDEALAAGCALDPSRYRTEAFRVQRRQGLLLDLGERRNHWTE